MDLYDYSRWENFTKDELVCQHTGLENPNIEEFIDLMDSVQELRHYMGIPFEVTSCYRHESHPIEANKDKPGRHNFAAIDIHIPVKYCYEFVSRAMEMGFTGVGINLAGDYGQRFIHLDKREGIPKIWSY